MKNNQRKEIKNKKLIIEILSYFPSSKKLEICKKSKFLQTLLNITQQHYETLNPYYQLKHITQIIQKEASPNSKAKTKTKQIIKSIIENNYLKDLQLLNPQKIFIDSTGNFVNSILELTGQYIIIALNKETKLKIFDLKNRKIYKTLSGHKSNVFKIISPNSKKSFFISITFEGEIIQWDSNKYNIIAKKHYNSSGVIQIKALKKSPIFINSFAASYWDLSIEIFTMEQKLFTIKDDNINEAIITFNDFYDSSQQNHFLYTSSRNNNVTLFGLLKDNNYAELRNFKMSNFCDENRYVTAILPIPMLDKIFYGFNNGQILSMNLNCSKTYYLVQPHCLPVNCLVLLNKKRMVISSGFKDKNICVFSCDDIRNRIIFNLRIGVDNSVIQLNDGRILFSNEGRIKTLYIDIESFTLKIEKGLIAFKE